MELVKDLFRHATGLSDPVLHVLIGMGLYLVFVALLKRPLRSWLPLAALLGVELLNEAFDAAEDFGSIYGVSIRGSLFDIAITMVLPGAIVLCATAFHHARYRHVRHLR
ncbi:hypothetical protein [Pelagibacterium sp. H642]|uniref:hypothetical protein n=1 Tax=Pelagibacterium sp. H642 TaxID=1881069 RepID=UPI0028156883|nr:hypothetical protein [Pelagibacterium sp. H642]WMT92793.1 hypothetical protein NO934_18600 [Pelagibacterium sp. H642]